MLVANKEFMALEGSVSLRKTEVYGMDGLGKTKKAG
jgi:hypothetical protein